MALRGSVSGWRLAVSGFDPGANRQPLTANNSKSVKTPDPLIHVFMFRMLGIIICGF